MTSSVYRLTYARQTVEAAKFTTLLKQDTLTFEEVDFSQCNLTSDTVKLVLEICKRCPKLKILKLFKNQLDDKGAESLVELLSQKPQIEEVHLSHNLFTAAGCRCLVEACEKVRSEKCQPLWLRLEQNMIADAETLCDELCRDLSVCRRADETRCIVRSCVNKKKVHIPFFHVQKASTFVSRAEREAQARNAAAAKARPVPVRTLSMKSDSTPKAAPRPCAWGAPGSAARPAPAVQDSPQSGYPSLGAKEEQEAKPAPIVEEPKLQDAKKPSWKAGSRTSIVLDSFGQRRTMPEQLEKADPSFVCSLCSFVMVRPVITRCSHLFCQRCFGQWAQKQVELHKSQKTNVGPVPQIRCPASDCKQLLKKTDVELADDGKTGGAQIIRRLRDNLSLRCVHHRDHHGFDFGKDAERVLREQGISCNWSGPPTAYEEHMASGCPVENYLKSLDGKDEKDEKAVDDTTLSTDATNNESTRPQYEGEPEPEDSVTVFEGSAPPMQDSNLIIDEGEVRLALHDYTPEDGVEGQIAIRKGDLVKVFKVAENGWAAGVKVCKETKLDDGDVGWFPAGYLAGENEEYDEENT